MMPELIAIIILLASAIGLVFIIFRKIPTLVQLSESGEEPALGLWTKLIEKIKNFPPLKSFSSEIFIQKILSRVRVLAMRAESKIGLHLQKRRENSQKKNDLQDDNYWQDLTKPKEENSEPPVSEIRPLKSRRKKPNVTA